MKEESLTVFVDSRATITGGRDLATATVRRLAAQGRQSVVLVFDDANGEQVDLDLREGDRDIGSGFEEPERRRPGRPRLGVVAREVTLLPRHWEWLGAQPGGASVALRKLVEQARRSRSEDERVRRSQEAAFRFMNAIAGNEPGFEEACRALFARDQGTFEAQMAGWPTDVVDYAVRLAADAFVDVAD